ncbi:Alpha/Beta hydrolase protein [Staphylotrichum tortipilum]|uniref:Alpha/Beta hydrolase protein n=1 Tax=Staphylotrichum tortipilum TaxID=2831512 RepID=A0AAN6MKB7_9PEZI|nr:Alpha/Beta hydrolase protein [Staphylotrichum longicolle]
MKKHTLEGGVVVIEYARAPRGEPVVIRFHGGGFVMGTVVEDAAFCHLLCLENHVKVVSVDYELAPATKFPKVLDHSIELLDFARELSSHPVTLMGMGAGANIALAMALKVIEQGRGGGVSGVIALSPLAMHPDAVPPVQKAQWTSLNVNDELSIDSKSVIMSWLAAYGAPPTDPLMLVLLHEKLGELNCVYTLGYVADTLYNDARFLVEALAKAGVRVNKDFYQGYPHLAFAYPSHSLANHREDVERNAKRAVRWMTYR